MYRARPQSPESRSVGSFAHGGPAISTGLIPTPMRHPCATFRHRLWLIGLGHLGQAYLWALGLLPYLEPASASG